MKTPLAPSPESADPDRVVRVHTDDGTFVDLYRVWADSAAITGLLVTEQKDQLSEPIEIRIPNSQVVGLEDLQPDQKGNIAGTAIGGGVLVAAALGAALVLGILKWLELWGRSG